MVQISQFASLLRSRLWDRFLTWAADGRPASFFISQAAALNYVIADDLTREGRSRAFAEVKIAVRLGDLGDDERLPRFDWMRDRSIRHAYEVTATTEYCDEAGSVVARRRDTVGFDRNPTGAELQAKLQEAAEDRLARGTDPTMRDEGLTVCGQTITEGWRRTA